MSPHPSSTLTTNPQPSSRTLYLASIPCCFLHGCPSIIQSYLAPMPSLPSAPPLCCLSFAPSPRLRRSAGSSVPSAGGCAGSAGALPSPGMPAPPSVCYPKTLQTGDHCDFQGLGPRELRPQNSPGNAKVKMKTWELFCFSLGLWGEGRFCTGHSCAI